MSSWWSNKIMLKDSFNDNIWLNQMYIFYLAKKYSKKISIETDDKLLTKLLFDENYKPYKLYITNFFLLTYRFTTSFVCNFFLILISKTISFTNKINKYSSSIVWFRTHYPVEWNNHASPRLERLYGDSVYYDLETSLPRSYFTIIQSSFFSLNPFKTIKNYFDLKRLSNSTIKHQLSHSFLSFYDLFKVYTKSIYEIWFFIKLLDDKSFQNLFIINNISFFPILINQWFKTYDGYQQNSRLEALSLSKLSKSHKIKNTHYIITYGELFAHNRTSYHLAKKLNLNIRFIAVQHAMNAKNKLFTYHSSHEFNFNSPSKHFSPFPDYFLTQGLKYKTILSEFYDSSRVSTIGSLKNISFKKKRIPLLENYRNNGFKIILLTPSLGYDYKGLIELFSHLDNGCQYKLFLTFHPAMVTNDVISFQRDNYPKLDINYLTGVNTYSVLHYANLVVAGYSTIIFEAISLGKNVVSYLPLGSLPQYDQDSNIPSFNNPIDFQKWFDSFFQSDQSVSRKIIKQVERDYFYKNDNYAGKRLWQFILNLDKVDNN